MRDNDYAKSAVRVVRNSVVGTGVRLQAQVMRQRGGKLDIRINEQIEKSLVDVGSEGQLQHCRPALFF